MYSDKNFSFLSPVLSSANEMIKPARLPLLLAGKQRFAQILVHSSPTESKLTYFANSQWNTNKLCWAATGIDTQVMIQAKLKFWQYNNLYFCLTTFEDKLLKFLYRKAGLHQLKIKFPEIMQVKADFYFYGFFFLRDFHANKNCMRCWDEMPVIRTKCWKKNTHTIIGNVLGSVLNCRKIPCPESFQFLCMSCVAFRKRK